MNTPAKILLPLPYDRLSPKQRKLVREAYVEQQHGLCYHCRSPLNLEPPEFIRLKPVNQTLFPPNFFKHPVHLHHSHLTGLTLGAVHSRCNAVLWQHYGE